MENRSAAELTLAFGLATFQTCLLVFVPLLILFRSGDLGEQLESLDTLLGFALFGLLWLMTFYCTLRAVAEIGLAGLEADDLGNLLRCGMRWGATDGLLVFLVLAVALLGLASVLAVASGSSEALIGIAIFGLVAGIIGGILAMTIGTVLGLVAALLEVLFVRLARATLGPVPRPPPAGEQ